MLDVDGQRDHHRLMHTNALGWLVSLVVACGVAACDDDAEIPTCADLGCPLAPSGEDRIWTPCESEICYCGEQADVCTMGD